ncbi:MAG: DUF2490 domain-containing protein [Saprospiraceae bacterium]|nr:DUF2490 domain-containing protein [Saprospiraceae bacterium]
MRAQLPISLLIIMLQICTLSGQSSLFRETYSQAKFWTSINSAVRLSKHWGVTADVHVRRRDFLNHSDFYFLRMGGAYWINDQFSFVGGVAALWLATDTEVGQHYALERRLYQQGLWRAVIGKVTFLQRIRTEQRWHQVLDRANASVDRVRFSSRFRFLMSAAIQVFRSSKFPRPTLSNEILFHVGKEITYNTFDQNRVFLGINQRIAKNWTVDCGYMMVYQQRYSGNEYDLQHTFRLFFYYSPDFRKKMDDDLPHYPVGGIE